MQQLLLDFPHSRQYFTEDFIVTDASKKAFELIINWREQWGVNPFRYFILLYGPATCGKTHLAHIWQREGQAYFVSPNEELTHAKLEKYNNFILEDIENQIWDEVYLFHTFNKLHELKKKVLFTSQLAPLEIEFNLADLKSRINSILSISICCPSDDLLKIMLLKHFSERELKVSIDVVNFLANRIPREFSEVSHIVDVLDRAALMHKRNITIPLIKDVLEV